MDVAPSLDARMTPLKRRCENAHRAYRFVLAFFFAALVIGAAARAADVDTVTRGLGEAKSHAVVTGDAPGDAPVEPSDSYLLVVTGLGGEPYYAEKFSNWADTLVEVATGQLNLPPDRVIYLTANGPETANVNRGPATKQNILGAMDRLRAASKAGDKILIVLIGHGSIDGKRALFNLPGPDISAAEFAPTLDALSGRNVALVNTTPASSSFVQALSSPGRIIITATSSGAENTHTRFADAFASAFMESAADADKDRYVSLLEAFTYSTTQTQRYYESEGELATEHAQLDDDGDGIGSRTPGMEDNADGQRAKQFVFAESENQGSSVNRAERLTLQVQARRLVDRVESLKRRKRTLGEEDYQTQLEALLIELAYNRRDYRRAEPRGDSP
jgi:hypothetical protein